MSANLVVARRGSGVTVETDAELIQDCVNAIRNALIPVHDRQPLSFDHSERRHSARVPMHVPVQLTPMEVEDGSVRLAEGRRSILEGFTTDLSLRGVGFTHERPLSHRHVAVTFELPDVPPVSLLVEICWSLPLDEGGHHTGGRFLSLIEFTERTNSRFPR
jgi:hypothetical protein